MWIWTCNCSAFSFGSYLLVLGNVAVFVCVCVCEISCCLCVCVCQCMCFYVIVFMYELWCLLSLWLCCLLAGPRVVFLPWAESGKLLLPAQGGAHLQHSDRVYSGQCAVCVCVCVCVCVSVCNVYLWHVFSPSLPLCLCLPLSLSLSLSLSLFLSLSLSLSLSVSLSATMYQYCPWVLKVFGFVSVILFRLRALHWQRVWAVSVNKKSVGSESCSIGIRPLLLFPSGFMIHNRCTDCWCRCWLCGNCRWCWPVGVEVLELTVGDG